MTEMTITEAIDTIKSLFKVLPWDKREDGKSFVTTEGDKTTFWLDKRQYYRGDIIQKLVDVFRDVNIKGGQVRIEPFTLLWTCVHVEPRQHQEPKK